MRQEDGAISVEGSRYSARVARGITRCLENPVINLVKGFALLWIGLSEASTTLADDIVQKRLRVGHGLIIIGLFGILHSLPRFIGSLEASRRYAELRNQAARPDLVPGDELKTGDD